MNDRPMTQGASRFAAVAVYLAAQATVYAQVDPAIAFIGVGGTVSSPTYELMVMNADGTNRATLWARTLELREPAWSPDLDGSAGNGFQGALVVVARDPDLHDSLYLLDVRVIGGAPAGLNLRVLVDADADPLVGNLIKDPEWSQDLDPLTPGYQGQIAYQGSADGGMTSSVNLIALAWDGATAQPLFGPNSSTLLFNGAGTTYSGARDPTWSPDGARVALKDIGSTIKIVDSGTGIVTSVLSGFSSPPFDLQWSRVGSRLAFRLDSGNPLYTVDVDLGMATLRASPNAAGESPSWSPDDQFLVYSDFSKLMRVNVASGAKSTLATVKKKTLRYPDWRR